MKRLVCAILACLLLCGCASAPVLREGYYLAPLEETGDSPMYFCLEPGGSGYVHAMGEDVAITWTSEGISGEFSDGVPTEDGIEFPDGLVFPYSKELPEEYTQPILRPGFYIPEGEEFDSLMCYAELRTDGTGEFSIMGMSEPIEWEPTKFYLGDLIGLATAEGFVVTDEVPVEFTWIGDALPEGYLPEPPTPGVYCVSSVGYSGDISFYGTFSRDNGYLELRADNTGTLVFENTSYDFELDGLSADFGDWSMSLIDMGDDGSGDPPLMVGYTYDGCPIEADSIAFRLLEGE